MRANKFVLKLLLAAIAVLLAASYMLLGASSHKGLSNEELVQYVADPSHGLTKEKVINGVSIKATYRPTDLIVAQELRDGAFSEEDVKRLREQYGSYSYFVLSFSADGKDITTTRLGSFSNFSQRLQTLAFDMDRYVYLLNDRKDTIPVLDFIYPRNFGMSPTTSLLFVFDGAAVKNSGHVIFNIDDIGMGTGRTRFKFRKKDLSKIPTLSFNTSHKTQSTNNHQTNN